MEHETLQPETETEKIAAPAEQTPAPETAAPDAGIHDAPPVKRGRGRPRKNPEAEPVTARAATKKTAAKKTTAKKTYTSDDITLMGKQLCGLHIMAAQMTGIPEIAIGEEESQLLAQSIVNVADQYDLAIDGKTGAALQLVLTAAMIYGPRVLAVRARAAQARAQAAGDVVNVPATVQPADLDPNPQ
jgi:hypothetical protein